MGVGGGGVSRRRFIKDVGVNRTEKKVGPRQATTAAKSSKNNKVVRSADSAKISANSFRATLTSPNNNKQNKRHFFSEYTIKQWKIHTKQSRPSCLSASLKMSYVSTIRRMIHTSADFFV